MSKEAAARIAVRDSLVRLVEMNHLFCQGVQADHGLPIWIMGAEKFDERLQAATVSTRLTYVEEQNKQETARLTGLVGISEQTFALGKALNDSREQFKSAIAQFRELFGDDIAAIEQASDDLRDGLLGGLQIKHLHFVQCYRQLKLFLEPPKRVGFSWAVSHSGTVRLTAQKAIDHLQKKFLASVAVTEDINLLKKMSADEIVVIRRELAPHLRANITWTKEIRALREADSEQKKKYPAQINSPLPLFIQLIEGQPLPEFNRIKPFDPYSKQERLTRSDACLVKLNNNPHSRIYCYA